MMTSPVGLQSHMPHGNHRDAAPWYPRGLEEARRVQQHLLPRRMPEVPGWDLAAACRPARVVSGDYHDLFELGPGRIALALGDVAGKGLGPALVMAGLRALIRSWLPRQTTHLAGLMAELNDYLLATTPDDMFVTLFLGVLDGPTGRLRYANAGHLPPVVLADGEVAEPVRFQGDSVLGVFPDACFEEGEVRLGPGSLFALVSDGLTEARDGAGRMFQQRRVVESLQAAWGAPVAAALAGLLEAVEQFRGAGEQADDISVILLRRLGRSGGQVA
jgi:sigma-B regulation protein RsbU (phosphoserine phosphatase)